MKHFRLLIVLLAMTSAGQLSARIGNNEEQIAELYGKPVNSGFPDRNGVSTNSYQKGDYLVLVQFLRHLSIAESYTRTDKREFLEEELIGFLEGRGYSSQEWIKDPDRMAWERIDHHARAWCETISGRPTFLIHVK
jgi:hypothetical protein